MITLAGLTLAWRRCNDLLGAPPLAAVVAGCAAVLLFVVLSVAYLFKAARYPAAVTKEFNSPIAGNFFATVPISMLLTSTVVLPLVPDVSLAMWTIAAVSTIALAFTIVSRVMRGTVDAGHAVPAWLIPSVATFDVVVAGGTLPMEWARQVNLIALAIGCPMTLVFFTMVMSRLIHHQEKLATGMLPSLMILTAPFEVGFVAYSTYFDRVDTFASMLFYFGLFLFFSVVFKICRRGIPFAGGWWAFSAPLAVVTNAAFRYADHARYWPNTLLAVCLMVLLHVVVAVLLVRTLKSLFAGQLLSPP